MNKLEIKQELTKQRAELDREISRTIELIKDNQSLTHSMKLTGDNEKKRSFKASIRQSKKQIKLANKRIMREISDVAIATMAYEKAKNEEQ